MDGLFHGNYRALIHVDVYRVLTAEEAERTRWCSAEMKSTLKALMRFPEREPEAAHPSAAVQPGAAGVTGLRQALEGTAAERERGKLKQDEDGEEADKDGGKPAKEKKRKRTEKENEESEGSAAEKDYGKIIQKRKALSQAESALRLRATKKKKKKKSRGSKPKEIRSTSSSDESSKESIT